MKNLAYVLISIGLLANGAFAASFNCDKATTFVEKTICSNAELSQLDDALAIRYQKEVKKAGEHKDELRHFQLLWLKFQRNTCPNATCLIREYKERLGQSKGYGIAWDKPSELGENELPKNHAFGQFSSSIKILVANDDAGKAANLYDETNNLSIHAVSDKPYLAVIDSLLFFDYGHMCNVTDELATWSENHWVINGEQNGKTTELRIYPVTHKNKTQLFLRDINNKYRVEACGMNGYFDGLIFERL